jgi:4'-phosphopantetheinyl transferase
MILARYMDEDPRQLRFWYGAHGKPVLGGASGAAMLGFNLSHSCDLALYAVAKDREVGVDLERIRRDFPCEEMADRFFSKRERDMLRTLPKPARTEAFFNYWTRKEAYVKARGGGLSLPLDDFSVSAAPNAAGIFPETGSAPKEGTHWSSWAFAIHSGYVAGLAVEGSVCHFKFWQCELAERVF